MRCLKYASAAALLMTFVSGCAKNPYRRLEALSGDGPASVEVLRQPAFSRVLYRCVVDGGFLFKRYHLSGVLLFKSFDDGSQRAVFQNEMGISFFNFKWDRADSFSVTSAMPQLARPAIIRTLRTDFELLLRKNLDTSALRIFGNGATHSVRVGKNTGYAWYDTDGKRITYGAKSVVTSITTDSPARAGTMPQNVRIDHPKARFTIDLSILPPDEN